MKRKWWKESVVYQVYPQSFMDSNGDGFGDLRGLIEKLDYIKELDANVIWLCPVYLSPKADNGYDICGYRDISPEYGTLDDMRLLIEEMHKRNMKLLMDLVVNHTSDEHPWFIQSRSSRTNPYRDYYIWRDGKNGAGPNNWTSFFGGDAWAWDEHTNQYYLHLFSEKQPDLNWENPAVRQEVYDIMKFWLDLGVDGFRMDVINLISKVPGLPSDGDPAHPAFGGRYFMNGPRIHEYLQEMNRAVFSGRNVMTVGEMPGVTVELAKLYTGEDRGELNMVFQFDLMELDGPKISPTPLNLQAFKDTVVKWQFGLSENGWNSIYLGNHDQPRQVSRFGNDRDYHDESAKMLCTLNMTLQGTPFVYYGEELGMTNAGFTTIGQYRDIETLNLYRDALANGKNEQEILDALAKRSRDNARTPMQWAPVLNAGFTSGKPWLSVNPNYTKYNVETEQNDPDSVLQYYKKMIRLRRSIPTLIYGKFVPVDCQNPYIFSYLRELDGCIIWVLLNFSESQQAYKSPENISNTFYIYGNYQATPTAKIENLLRPYESIVQYVSLT